MAKLYTKNLTLPIEISEQDKEKIGRGQEIGHEYGTVTELNTGRIYKVFAADCGLRNGCNCAVTVEEL